MRLFIGMLIATFLLGCVTADQQYKELSSKKEVIKSFFIADNRIYAIVINLIVKIIGIRLN